MANLYGESPFEVLGVGPGADAAAVRSAYRRKVKECHPDQFPEGEERKAAQEELIRRELERMMEQLLGDLNERQRRVLRLRFGMEDGVCYSLEQVGQLLGVSKERARQIERQAMDKLQQLGTGMGLEDFLE